MPRTAEELREYRRQWRKTPKAKAAQSRRNKTPEAKAWNRAYQKRRLLALRTEVFNLLGGCFCKACGFSDMRALQIDHINDDGYLHRKTVAYWDGKSIYRAILKDPDASLKYQVLCANCNWIKRHVNGEDQ